MAISRENRIHAPVYGLVLFEHLKADIVLEELFTVPYYLDTRPLKARYVCIKRR